MRENGSAQAHSDLAKKGSVAELRLLQQENADLRERLEGADRKVATAAAVQVWCAPEAAALHLNIKGCLT